MSEQPSGSFNEGEFVCEAALQQYTYAIVSGHVGRRNQRDIFADPDVGEVLCFGQNVQMSRNGSLNLAQFSSKFLDKDFLKTSGAFHRLLADESEALVKRAEGLLCKKDASVDSFFYIRILNELAHFLIDGRLTLHSIPYVAEQENKKFLRAFDRHLLSPFSVDPCEVNKNKR